MKSVAELQNGLGKTDVDEDDEEEEDEEKDDEEEETKKKKRRLTKVEKQMNGREHLRREAAQQKEKEIKKKKVAKKAAAANDPTRPKKQTAFTKPVKLSSQLSEFLGYEIVPRTEVTKLMWKYIKEHELQDPEQKQVIMCDEKMEQLFEKKQFTMFEMTKYLSKVWRED
jgi:upstream activation factor subunit UAF30